MSNLNPTMFNAERAAKRLGLSKSTLAKMRLSGNGPPYVKLGRRVGYLLSDLDEWVESNKFHSTAEYEVAKAFSGSQQDV